MFSIFIPCDIAYYIHCQGLLYSFKLLLDVEHQINIIDMGLSKKNIESIQNNF